MQRFPTLLLNRTIISGGFAVQSIVVSTYTKNVFQEHLNHNLEKASSSNRILCNQVVLDILVSNIRVVGLISISKVQC